MKYAYQRTGAPLIRWNAPTGVPPHQTRAADSVSLGGLVMPAPGAPEPIGDYVAMGGCSCTGTCGCTKSAVGDVADAIANIGSVTSLAVSAIAAVYVGNHGYRRHDGSVGWGIAYGALGWLLPIVGVPLALLQGSGPARRDRRDHSDDSDAAVTRPMRRSAKTRSMR